VEQLAAQLGFFAAKSWLNHVYMIKLSRKKSQGLFGANPKKMHAPSEISGSDRRKIRF
jgi:hypothetical protein